MTRIILRQIHTPDGWPNAATAASFLAGIDGRTDALEQIEGWMAAEMAHPSHSHADVALVANRRIELQRRAA